MISGVFGISRPDVVYQEFDGDLVVLNLSTGQYFGPNLPASLLWEEIFAGTRLQMIAYAWPRPDEVKPSFKRLVSLGLVVQSEDPEGEPGEEIRARYATATGTSVVDVFDDLEDISLSRIHSSILSKKSAGLCAWNKLL